MSDEIYLEWHEYNLSWSAFLGTADHLELTLVMADMSMQDSKLLGSYMYM